MAKYTREEYEAGLEKAKAAQDKGAINYFQGKKKIFQNKFLMIIILI